MIALIDMDLVCYRCAASAEHDPIDIVFYRMNDLLDTILEKTKATEYRAFLSGEDNFRKKIYPEYKANRTQPKPIHLEAARYYAVKELGAEAEYELEADDLLGIHQTEESIICSLDKDLLQIPGNHFQWEIRTPAYVKPDSFTFQTELGGLRLFYEQCIKGDPTDNIKGIPKMGKVRAEKELKDCSTELEMFKVVKDLYHNDEEFLMNAGCLWILRGYNQHYKDRFNELNASI